MSDEFPHLEPAPDDADDATASEQVVEPAAEEGERLAAGELYVHGLLMFLHARNDDQRRIRVARVMEALKPAAPQPRSLRFRRWTGWPLAVAAVIAITAVSLMLGLPAESSALAEVRRTIEVMRAGGERRYEVFVMSWEDAGPRNTPSAVVDMSASGLLVIGHTPPRRSEPIYVGRDADGIWATREDGSIERENPRRYWPPWAVDDKTWLVDSLDRLLEQMTTNHDLVRESGVRLDAQGNRLFDLITGTRVEKSGPYPPVIAIWIDRSTKLVEQVEMRWEDSREKDGHRSPRMILFRRIEPPALPADWFKATTDHDKK